ncbi:MAG: winged helix-turn-helix domain-containing protein [Ruminococcus flavefaciens]|nr:winged helix-turn-helix domain-containing protein [Ruminococcus flavefaciens]
MFFILADGTPDQLKLKGCLWTRNNVRELIQQRYGIIMPIRTIGEYLKCWGLTVQHPAKREMEQKPE